MAAGAPAAIFTGSNLGTEPDVYPVPYMLDFASKAAGCTFFSKIDLRLELATFEELGDLITNLFRETDMPDGSTILLVLLGALSQLILCVLPV